MATQKNDIAFGEKSEMTNLEVLQEFLQTKLERKGGYSVIDFENPAKTIMVELKTRRIPHDRYESALIGCNKIAFAEQMKDIECWFAFCYTDGLYVIKYERELFEEFEISHSYKRSDRADCNNHEQSVVYIPVKHLSKVEPSSIAPFILRKTEIKNEQEEKSNAVEDITLPHASGNDGVIRSKITYDA
jgi:hypothetical protein